MKALMFFYIVIWIYATYYACYILYRLLGDDAIPLYVSFGLLALIRVIASYESGKL